MYNRVVRDIADRRHDEHDGLTGSMIQKHLLVVHCQLVSLLGKVLSVPCGESLFDNAHGNNDMIDRIRTSSRSEM
jgi:hypothetical protein